MPDEKDNNEKIAAATADAQKHAVASRDKQLKSEKEASDKATKAQLERVSNLKPTPTQAENDRAKLGQTLEELDDKEDHGAPEERQVSADKGTAGALNRSVSTK